MPLRWSKSQQVEFDENGIRAGSAVAEFFIAGTTTPLTVYEDSALTEPHGSTVTANGVGRWPDVFIPFSSTDFKETISTAGGTQLWTSDNLDRLDPVEAAADTVDNTQLLQTGDWVFAPVDEIRTGFVRANGRTIGSATSGATERANADTEDLFTYLWNKNSNAQLAVSGGRGASAAADFAANKTIALHDCRGGYPIGLDTMGNTAGGFLSSAPFTNGLSSTPGSLLGLNTHTLITAELPVITPAGSISGSVSFTPTGSITGTTESFTPAGSVSVTLDDPGHTHPYLVGTSSNPSAIAGGHATHDGTTGATTTSNTTGITVSSSTFTGNPMQPGLIATFTGTPVSPSISASFSGTSFGSATPFNIVSRAISGTWYIKL